MEPLKAKKKYSQNFLVNKDILSRLELEIRRFLEYNRVDRILEIGPGTGQLTQILLDTGKKVTSVEIDQDAIEGLSERFKNNTDLEIIQGDFTDLLSNEQFINKLKSSPTVLISNLPFNTGSRMVVDLGVMIPEMSFLVILQKEVVQKVLDNKSLTLFSLWLNYFWDFEKVIDIPRYAFDPQPRVTSSLLKASSKKNNTKNALYEINTYQFLDSKEGRRSALQILKHLTSHPRKTIYQNLLLSGYDKDYVEKMYHSLYLEKNIRLNKRLMGEIIQYIWNDKRREKNFKY